MINQKKKGLRSPLKDKPLRNPGQSLDEELDLIFQDKVVFWFMLLATCIMLIGMEWFRWYTDFPPAPITVTLIVTMVIIVAVIRIVSHAKRYRRIKLGRDGERVVGQFLEQKRDRSSRVFHDIVGDGFNVDHVFVGPQGIFTIETKTKSKPNDKDARVVFDGKRILVGGKPLDRDPVKQAKAQASWVQSVLKESTGRTFQVRPVIVFPGWFVESSKGAQQSGVWVLEPKALPGFLKNESNTLSAEDTHLAAFHLSRYIRTAQ